MCLILAVCRFSGLDVLMPGCQSPWWYQSGVLAYPNKYLSIEISQSTLPTYLEHSSLLLLDCARLVIGSLGLYNSSLTTAIRMCHSPSSSMHYNHHRGTTDHHISVNFTSQTTMPFLFSPTELLESRTIPSEKSASSDTPTVLVSQLATERSGPGVTISSLQIQYFGHGWDPLGNLPGWEGMTRRR